jgi:hypothetical protein
VFVFEARETGMMKNIDMSQRGLDWNAANPSESLAALRAYVEEEALKASNWYMQRKGTKAFFSRYLRLGAIVAAAAGGLYPIAESLYEAFEKSASTTTTATTSAASSGLWASLFVGCAAALVGLDKAFGFSTGWIRYMTTASIIRKSLEEFRMDWTLKLAEAGSNPPAEKVLEFVQLAKRVRLAIEDQVLEETKAWASEFQNNLSQLEREVRQQAEAQRSQADKDLKTLQESIKPGSIELSVANAKDADNYTFQVRLEGASDPVEETVTGSTSWGQLGLKPGHYKLTVSASTKNRPVRAMAVCEVAAGQLLKVAKELPLN